MAIGICKPPESCVARVLQMPPKAKTAGKARGPAKRKLAEEFPPGEVLTDNAKKSWKLGSPIGQGGFGLIYLGKRIHTSHTILLF